MTATTGSNAYTALLLVHFQSLKDPRRTSKGNIIYPFIEILFLTISACICGCTDYVHIKDFGDENLDWLRKYFPYKAGICSDDVIRKLFQKIDHDCFNDCYMAWAKQTYNLTNEELIAIDGKRIRGSYDTTSNIIASHIVSAFVSSSGITLGQVATEEKSNEITAIPALLDKIDIEGTIISIDAMGCQKSIAKKIVSKKANYLLAVKGNQKELQEQVMHQFTLKLPFETHCTREVGHGRVEKRTATVLNDLSLLDEKDNWINLNSIIKLETERYDKTHKTTSCETRYYISSCANYTAEKMNTFIRSHWAIENLLHWHLDVNFGEDNARKRIGNSAKNFNLVLKTGLTLLKRDELNKISIRRKKIKATFNEMYRDSLFKS